MAMAEVFKSGRCQAVRLPEEYRFNESEVVITKIGEAVILTPKESKWAEFLSSLDLFSDDFMMDGREQEPVQERESL